jgi:hypothetical protein
MALAVMKARPHRYITVHVEWRVARFVRRAPESMVGHGITP